VTWAWALPWTGRGKRMWSDIPTRPQASFPVRRGRISPTTAVTRVSFWIPLWRKVSTDGTQLVYAGYIVAAVMIRLRLAVDGAGQAYVGVYRFHGSKLPGAKVDQILPLMVASAMPFVAKVSANGRNGLCRLYRRQ